jgi:hypothetical protein
VTASGRLRGQTMKTPSKDKQHQALADVRALRLWAAWQRAGYTHLDMDAARAAVARLQASNRMQPQKGKGVN